MGKKDMGILKLFVVVLVAVVIGGWVLTSGILSGGTQFSVAPSGGGSGSGFIPIPPSSTGAVAVSDCPDARTTTVTWTHRNGLDTTRAFNFDVTANWYKIDPITGEEVFDQQTTDSTAGSVTLTCGKEYVVRIVSSTTANDGGSTGLGDSGDNARILGIDEGVGATLVNEPFPGAGVHLKASDRAYTLRTKGSLHGFMEFRIFDIDANAFMYNDSDLTNLNNRYFLEPFNASCTTSENCSTAVGAGGTLNIRLDFRATGANSSTTFNDFGYWFLLEAPTGTWNEPGVVHKYAGVMTNAKGDFTPYENRQFSSYEYAYKVPAQYLVEDTPTNSIETAYVAIAGQNPSVALEQDFAAIGAYTSVDGTTTRYGAALDDSANTVTHTIMDVTIPIS